MKGSFHGRENVQATSFLHRPDLLQAPTASHQTELQSSSSHLIKTHYVLTIYASNIASYITCFSHSPNMFMYLLSLQLLTNQMPPFLDYLNPYFMHSLQLAILVS